MKIDAHCTLCNHSQQNITQGRYCGLTGEKPQFTSTCDTILLNDKLKHITGKLHGQLYILEKEKRYKYTITILLLLAMITLCITTVIFMNRDNSFNIYSRLHRDALPSGIPVYFSIAAIACGLSAIKIFVNYRKELTALKGEIQEIKNTLSLYGLTYDVVVKTKKHKGDGTDIYTATTLTSVRA